MSQNSSSHHDEIRHSGDILDQQYAEFRETKMDNYMKRVITERLMKLIERDDIMGATFTLRPIYYTKDDKLLHREIELRIMKSTVWKDTYFYMFPEFTKQGNLHYHIIMYGVYQIKFMQCVKWWRRNYGFVKTELKINNNKNWVNYIIKDYGRTGLWTIRRDGRERLEW